VLHEKRLLGGTIPRRETAQQQHVGRRI